MKCLIGLGNPGSQYSEHRHNVGFMFVDYLLEKEFKDSEKKVEKDCLYWTEEDIILAKPQTYMNLSGLSARELIERFDLALEDILVAYDDISLDFGNIRIRKKGSAGGQNGLQSIIEHIDSIDFPRLRFGIGPKNETLDLADFVLSPFNPEEMNSLPGLFEKAEKAFQLWKEDSIDIAMNAINQKVKPTPSDEMGSNDQREF